MGTNDTPARLEKTSDEDHATVTLQLERARRMPAWPLRRTRSTTEELDGRLVITTITGPAPWSPNDAAALLRMAHGLLAATGTRLLSRGALQGGNRVETGAN
jgi:hypothetical protein